MMWSFNAIPKASPELLNFNQDHLSKKWFFWSNSYKILYKFDQIFIKYDNFFHINAKVPKLWSHDHIYIYNIIWVIWWNLVGDIMDIDYDVMTFILKYLCFKKA